MNTADGNTSHLPPPETAAASPSQSREIDALYNRIAVLRAERGLSRQQLAQQLGVNYQTIGYLERGDYNPSLDLALRIAELFRMPVETVFSRRPLRPLSEVLYGTRPPLNHQ